MSKSHWSLEIAYEPKFYPALDEKIDKIVGRDHNGSGMGFGARDLNYDFKTDADARAIGKRVKRLEGIKTVRVQFWDGNDWSKEETL